MKNSEVTDKLFEHTELKPFDLIKTIEGDVFEVAEGYSITGNMYAPVVIDVTRKKDKEGRYTLAVPYDEIVSVKRDGEYLNLTHFDNIPASYNYVLELKSTQEYTKVSVDRILESIKEHERRIEYLENKLYKEEGFLKANKQFIKRLTEINVDSK